MQSRRQFLRRSVAGSGVLALASLAGCLDETPLTGDDDQDERGYAAWLYDPTQFLDPDLTMFVSVDVERAKAVAGASLEDELTTFEDELDDVDGVEELDRMTGLVFGTDDGVNGDALGMGIAITGTFDVDALEAELESQEEFDAELVDREEYGGYEVYALEEDGDVGGVAMREDAVVFGFFEGVDVESTDPITAVLEEYESGESGYYEARPDGADLIDRLEGELSVTGIEFDASALGLEDESDPLMEELFGGLTAVGSASDVDGDGTVLVDAVLVYEDEASADAEAIESAIETLVMTEPGLEEELETLELSEEGRRVELSLSFDPDDVATDDPYGDPSMLLVAGAFPALAIVAAFVIDLGSAGTGADGGGAQAQVAVDISEDPTTEEVTVMVTSVADASDVWILTGTTEIHDLEAEAGSMYTLTAEDDEYLPGDTITVIGVTEDGAETVVATHETSA